MRAGAAVGIAALLTLLGCKLNTDYFSDYRGKNLLANYDFDDNDTGPPFTPRWAIEPYTPWSDNVTPSPDYDATYLPDDYVTWEPAADLSGLGLDFGPDGTSPAYRLEVKNLFTNGDFENQTNGAGFDAPDNGWWTPSAATVDFSDTSFTSVRTAATLSPISSRSLFFSGSNSGNGLAVTLDSTSVPLWPTGATPRKGEYRFHFDFIYASDQGALNVAMNNQGGSNAESAGDWTASSLATAPTTVLRLSKFFITDNSGAASTITLGSATTQDEAVIDNVRVVQADVPPFVSASFTSLSSGSLKLLPGSKAGAYKLRVWVHDDPTADQTGGSGVPHVANRLQPSGVTVQVTAAVKSGSGTFVSFVPRPASGWTTWTELVFSMGFDFVNSNADLAGNPALKLEIGPTNAKDLSTGGRDAGSLLIAQPSFTFNP